MTQTRVNVQRSLDFESPTVVNSRAVLLHGCSEYREQERRVQLVGNVSFRWKVARSAKNGHEETKHVPGMHWATDAGRCITSIRRLPQKPAAKEGAEDGHRQSERKE